MSAGVIIILIGCVSLAVGATTLIFWTAAGPLRGVRAETEGKILSCPIDHSSN